MLWRAAEGLWEYWEQDTERTKLKTGTHYLWEPLYPAKILRYFPWDLNKSHTEYANMILFFFIVPILVISSTPQITDENIQFCIKVAEPTYELVVAMESTSTLHMISSIDIFLTFFFHRKWSSPVQKRNYKWMLSSDVSHNDTPRLCIMVSGEPWIIVANFYLIMLTFNVLGLFICEL